MFGYYGTKYKIISKYPAPKCSKIIEPFAGAACYSLKYWDREVLLIEKYDVIYKIWKWLQLCSKDDILSLPILKCGESVDDYTFDCEEAKWFVGFNIAAGVSTPRKTCTKWKSTLRPNWQINKLKYASENLHKIRHWDIRLGDYVEVDNEIATWFIDPPYQVGGSQYKFHNINYKLLGEWSKERIGQVIVCEHVGADWLSFKVLTSHKGVGAITRVEGIYYQESES